MRKATENIRDILAFNIKSLRKKRMLSQDELAQLSGLHRTYIGSVERGERNVTLSSLEALSAALEVSVTELLSKELSARERRYRILFRHKGTTFCDNADSKRHNLPRISEREN